MHGRRVRGRGTVAPRLSDDDAPRAWSPSREPPHERRAGRGQVGGRALELEDHVGLVERADRRDRDLLRVSGTDADHEHALHVR